jgi:hypothetical protein
MKNYRYISNIQLHKPTRKKFLEFSDIWVSESDVNSLNTKLNPICHLLALLGAHHILHVSRIRVNEDSVFLRNDAILMGATCYLHLRGSSKRVGPVEEKDFLKFM